jgi:hypothetical protein
VVVPPDPQPCLVPTLEARRTQCIRAVMLPTSLSTFLLLMSALHDRLRRMLDTTWAGEGSHSGPSTLAEAALHPISPLTLVGKTHWAGMPMVGGGEDPGSLSPLVPGEVLHSRRPAEPQLPPCSPGGHTAWPVEGHTRSHGHSRWGRGHRETSPPSSLEPLKSHCQWEGNPFDKVRLGREWGRGEK